MSAFVVDRAHIEFLVSAAMSRRLSPARLGPMGWQGATGRKSLACNDYEHAAAVAQMLWDENVRSVRYRYPDCTDDLHGPIDCDFQYGEHRHASLTPDPVAVLKAIAGYAYQTCEHPEWETSEAFSFCESLKAHAINVLPGYAEAAWAVV